MRLNLHSRPGDPQAVMSWPWFAAFGLLAALIGGTLALGWWLPVALLVALYGTLIIAGVIVNGRKEEPLP